MTATERLRELLDERGVEWEALSDQQEGDSTITATRWHDGEGGLLTMLVSEPHGSTWDFFWLPTPEQAIAATLGAGTCHNCAGMEDVFECSACGGRYVSWELRRWARYCPDCGAKVVNGC